jgi:hypothetical protein
VELRADREAFLSRARPAAFAEQIFARSDTRKRRFIPVLAAPLLVSVAALVVVLLWSNTGERFKGDAVSIELFVRSGAQVVRYSNELRFQPGDTLQLLYTSSLPRYMTVLDADVQGKTTVLYHSALPKGSQQTLDRAWVLDSSKIDERIYVLVSDKLLDEGAVRNAVSGIDVRNTLQLPVDTLFQKSFLLARKRSSE